jgi:chromate transporter
VYKDKIMSEPTSEAGASASAINEHSIPHASLPSLFWLFFQIGAMSFGGGLMAWVYREVVEKRHWLPASDLLSGVALAQVLPGVNITNLSIYVGQRMRGALGAATCLIALLTAPFFWVIGLAAIYHQIEAISWAHAFMSGVATSAVGLVLSVTLKSIRTSVRGIGPIGILLGIFIAIGVLHWPLVPVVAVLAPISVVIAWYSTKPSDTAEDEKAKSDA